MKAITPTRVAAYLQFMAMVAVSLGFSVSTTTGAMLIGASGLIAVALTFAEAHIHVGKSVSAEVARALAAVKGLEPAINQLGASLPGAVGAEVRKVLATVEKGVKPYEHEVSGTTTVACKPAGGASKSSKKPAGAS
jgi:hypothetical protein